MVPFFFAGNYCIFGVDNGFWLKIHCFRCVSIFDFLVVEVYNSYFVHLLLSTKKPGKGWFCVDIMTMDWYSIDSQNAYYAALWPAMRCIENY